MQMLPHLQDILVVFGGSSATGLLDDVWTYDVDTNTCAVYPHPLGFETVSCVSCRRFFTSLVVTEIEVKGTCLTAPPFNGYLQVAAGALRRFRPLRSELSRRSDLGRLHADLR